MNEIPAVRIALLYRCYAQGPGGLKSGTLMNDELAMEEDWDKPTEGDERYAKEIMGDE